MHSDLSLHLHSEECQKVIISYYECHKENPYKKYLGACNHLDLALRRCLRKERLNKMNKKKYKDGRKES